MATDISINSVKLVLNGVETEAIYNGGTGYYEVTLTAPLIETYDKTGNTFNIDMIVESEDGTYTADVTTSGDYFSDLYIRSAYVLEVVKDRTQADVDLVNYLHSALVNNTITDTELAVYLNNDLKGALNKSDLLRIKSEIDFIQWYTNIGSNEDVPDLPNETYYESILQNINEILTYVPCTVSLPQHPFNTFTKWNMIEKALQDIVSFMEETGNYPNYIDIE